ncbi:hypothetical protein B0T16DRAFT_400338 [Cercophora newfieldiana]|uniref:Uncharacterized protein n=1 Tax=Cercophora newfieldiana TaxID=92897 RepID=A0AA39YSC8_9PEZI|nr:hypothetical protein B0T16DRAFT_400338 [Cercophora newfieldiana]
MPFPGTPGQHHQLPPAPTTDQPLTLRHPIPLHRGQCEVFPLLTPATMHCRGLRCFTQLTSTAIAAPPIRACDTPPSVVAPCGCLTKQVLAQLP